MLYQYNYAYLAEWLKANAQVFSVNTILQAIGSKSNNSLRSWEQRACAMPVITLLRFCNTFQIPIEAFICNTGEPFKNKVVISETAQFEPNGGYTQDPTQRQPGERRPLDPTNVKIVPSVLPNVNILTPCEEKETPNRNEVLQKIETAAVVESETSNSNNLSSLMELQQRHADNEAEHLKQQQSMLDIIKMQQAQIAALTKRLQEVQTRNRGYNTMVAEP